MTTSKLADVGKAAKHFGVHPETLRMWVRQGRIPCIRPTRKTIRFDLKEVDKALSKPIRARRLGTNDVY